MKQVWDGENVGWQPPLGSPMVKYVVDIMEGTTKGIIKSGTKIHEEREDSIRLREKLTEARNRNRSLKFLKRYPEAELIPSLFTSAVSNQRDCLVTRI